MSEGRVSATAEIRARPERVYALLADYHEGHPQILPKKYFQKLEVEEGGVGAGTRTRLTVRALGTTTVVHHVVSEPEPGRLLVESDVDGSTVTTFTVEPGGQGEGTLVTIATEFRTKRTGILGRMEGALTAMLLRRIYRLELAQLEEKARSPGS